MVTQRHTDTQTREESTPDSLLSYHKCMTPQWVIRTQLFTSLRNQMPKAPRNEIASTRIAVTSVPSQLNATLLFGTVVIA